MARQRRTNATSSNGNKNTNSSSSNGSTSVNNPPQISTLNILSYWKQFFAFIVLSVAVGVSYVGYLETRVITPFDDNRKVVTRSGLDVPEQFWGTYRPGVYFGLKTRDPSSPVTGLMWYFPRRLQPGGGGFRHWCEQSDNLERYGWLQHDGSNFGIQEIDDGPFQLVTSFVKRVGGVHGGDWTARIGVDLKEKNVKFREELDEEVSLIWYVALDENTKGFITPTNSATKWTGIRGETTNLNKFTIKLSNSSGVIEHESFLSANVPGLHLLTETVISSLRLKQSKHIVLAGDLTSFENRDPNFIAIQITAKIPFTLDVVYESESFLERDGSLIGQTYTEALQWHQTRFLQRFDNTFGLRAKGFGDREIKFTQAALSNMLGGIGYFYGASKVQSTYNKQPVPYWKAPLFTAVPSRSFFPRGFLWDEGFHGLLISQWDLDLELDIISHWFDLMNVEGWIAREQILGSEAEAKVPSEFIVQLNTNANPPTFFLTLQYILDKYSNQLNGERLNTLERLFPRIQAWFQWFNNTQRGPVAGSYRWRGRDQHTVLELNPKTLTSGLDDYPRASHPTDDERHIDLYCWIALAADTLAKLANLLDLDGYKYVLTAEYLKNNELMNDLHWSQYAKTYADYGLHTDSVVLRRPKAQPRSPTNHQNLQMTRKVLKPPEYRLVDTSFGYVSLFPMLLQLIDPDSEQLNYLLTSLRSEDMLWSDFGLRSLSKTAPLYMKWNTEHDPPYWRGQIWVNINFLAVRALNHYGKVEGPYRERASAIYKELRANLIKNVMEQYYKTGYVWEQYNDSTGNGSGCRPFTGWSALVVIMMGENY